MTNFLRNSSDAIGGLGSAVKGQTSQGLIVQNYCNSVLQQPEVNFSGMPSLSDYQTQLNSGLRKAKSNANLYLNTVQPSIITNVTNIDNFCNFYSVIPTVLPDDSTVEQWLQALNGIKTMADGYKKDSDNVATALADLGQKLSGDTILFTDTVNRLNTAVNGDKGVLEGIQKQLDEIESKIDGAIAGIVVSGLAIVGGIFITAVGAIASFVTAGTSTTLVVAGIGIAVAGAGGIIASSLVLSTLNSNKAKLLQQQASLKNEVKLAQGLSTGFNTLTNQVQQAIAATNEMRNAWNFLSNDLKNLSNNLENGIIDAFGMREIFLKTANGTMKTVTKDVTTIKTQMTGIISEIAPSKDNIMDFMAKVEANYSKSA